MKQEQWLSGACIIILGLAGGSVAAAQRILTVDNNGGPHADFTDLQAAMDVAVDGDIYHVLGSTTGYGDVLITRQVHLYGPGYNLARVYTEGYQSFYEATLGDVTIRPTLASSPAGSTVSGFKARFITINAADVTVDRNMLTGGILIDPISLDGGLSLIQPHRARVLRNYAASITDSNNSGALHHFIANNIFYGSSGGSLNNATFLHNYGSWLFRPTFRNCTVENNLLGSAASGSVNNQIRHNFFAMSEPDIQTAPTFFSQNVLVANTWDMRFGTAVDEFAALTTNSGAFDEAFQLAGDSLARGAGVAGVDLGPFAGPFPYQISGAPPLPRVIITVPGPLVVSPSSDLEIPITVILE
jgi:hypothetical protein